MFIFPLLRCLATSNLGIQVSEFSKTQLPPPKKKDMPEQMDQPQKEASRFLEFRSVPYGTKRDGELVLNRYSSLVTNGYEFPGAQAMLYAAGIKNQEDMRTKPQVGMKHLCTAAMWKRKLQRTCCVLTFMYVGVASVWWEGNPCKYVSPVSRNRRNDIFGMIS